MTIQWFSMGIIFLFKMYHAYGLNVIKQRLHKIQV